MCNQERGCSEKRKKKSQSYSSLHCFHQPALLPLFVGTSLCMVTVAKLENAKRVQDIFLQISIQNHQTIHIFASTWLLFIDAGMHIFHRACVRPVSLCKCLSFQRLTVGYISNAFACAGNCDMRPKDYHLPGWILGIPVLLMCLWTPVFKQYPEI